MTGADLPGLPYAPVDRWLRRALPEVFAGDWTASVISGGLSNVTYRLRAGERTVILRRPPLGGILPGAHDMLREQRVLSALAGTAVPVPAVLGLCADPAVLGAPFYLMDDVSGTVVRTAADAAALSVAQRAALAGELPVVLAVLHEVDPAAVGLADFGRPAGFTARQVRRWGEQWRRSATGELPDMDLLLRRLADAVLALPTPRRPAVVHGDYRLDNALVTLHPTPRIAAVLDWELSTLGDPLTDVGLAMTYWHDLGDAEREAVPVARGVTALPGFGTAADFARAYAAGSGTDLAHLDVYRALGALKLGVIRAGVHARHAGGHTVGDGHAGVQTAVPVLAARGLALLARGR